MNHELKELFAKLKKTQNQVLEYLDQSWLTEARGYAQKQTKEIKRRVTADVKKFKKFLEVEKKEFEKLSEMLPKRVKVFKSYIHRQKKDVSRFLNDLKGVPQSKKSTKKLKKRVKNKNTSSPKVNT